MFKLSSILLACSLYIQKKKLECPIHVGPCRCTLKKKKRLKALASYRK